MADSKYEHKSSFCCSSAVMTRLFFFFTISLSLGFLICKVGMIVPELPAPLNYCESNEMIVSVISMVICYLQNTTRLFHLIH